ncbi:MAG TPA: hypothetical protein VGW40_06225 [Allosphingosinicella sp.]|nr:hypothetical protein [Allosphingosinicella sp.]
MGKFSPERRARFVMFLGLAMLAGLFIFKDSALLRFDYDTPGAWLVEDGWIHALAAALILLGAWKWTNAREDARKDD